MAVDYSYHNCNDRRRRRRRVPYVVGSCSGCDGGGGGGGGGGFAAHARTSRASTTKVQRLVVEVAVVLLLSTTVLHPPGTTIRTCSGFPISPTHQQCYHQKHRHRLSLLQDGNGGGGGIDGWRDQVFDFPGTGDDRRLGIEDGGAPKEVCILPFPCDEILLQGETKQLRLYEDRFIKLFDDATTNHNGVVAMGLLANTGIIQNCPLAEIEAYNRMEGFGIFVTIRVVSRVQLIDITQQEPYIKAVCKEMNDNLPPNLEIPNMLATNIENLINQISDMEKCVVEFEETSSSLSDKQKSDNIEMQRRKLAAKLDDRFYDDLGDEEEEDVAQLDRSGRFKQAYQVAMATDTQGYCVSDGSTIDRTPRELAAIAWAAFSTELFLEEDAPARIQALDTDSLLERLKLASHLLKEKKNKLEDIMKKNDIKFKGEESDDEF